MINAIPGTKKLPSLIQITNQALVPILTDIYMSCYNQEVDNVNDRN